MSTFYNNPHSRVLQIFTGLSTATPSEPPSTTCSWPVSAPVVWASGNGVSDDELLARAQRIVEGWKYICALTIGRKYLKLWSCVTSNVKRVVVVRFLPIWKRGRFKSKC